MVSKLAPMASEERVAYRAQITAIDLSHLALIMITIITQLTLSVLADILHNITLLWYIPFLQIAMLGLITRMDTLEHRIGGFLKLYGDPWEEAKDMHKPTKYLMPLGDILCMLLSLPLLINAEYEIALSWHYYKGPAAMYYLLGTGLGIVVGIACWIAAATKAKTGFDEWYKKTTTPEEEPFTPGRSWELQK